ncbi:hypothetical protein [Aliifodinibius sp. S!AR15-10]|nr:hypothetical protein [Aliifodinibius sp. S!AR15-10]
MAVPQRRDHPMAGWFDRCDAEPLYMFGASASWRMPTIVEHCL